MADEAVERARKVAEKAKTKHTTKESFDQAKNRSDRVNEIFKKHDPNK